MMPKGVIVSENVQVSLPTVFCGLVSAGMTGFNLSLLLDGRGVLSLPTVHVAVRLSQEVDHVSQIKSSQYIYSYGSYKIKLHIYYKFYVFDACSVYTETEARP